jgi:hypothetical protein
MLPKFMAIWLLFDYLTVEKTGGVMFCAPLGMNVICPPLRVEIKIKSSLFSQIVERKISRVMYHVIYHFFNRFYELFR